MVKKKFKTGLITLYILLLTDLTNAKIQLFIEQNPFWNGSDKYSYVKPTTSEKIRALLGLMFIRGVMKQNLRNTHKVYFHKSSNPYIKQPGESIASNF